MGHPHVRRPHPDGGAMGHDPEGEVDGDAAAMEIPHALVSHLEKEAMRRVAGGRREKELPRSGGEGTLGADRHGGRPPNAEGKERE
ncbi:hypothetical protein E2562_020889 [Oryza meyeriana var. granulata]|uniref:Uncharacterized protein n=1 Tax=Oryza meyeriana var. granulata TaxID=110450 RepID=A0A6G1D617_9ORYZ|nr:hypothetical protein E2562_020889 [Oryza meyeriana var. granulata]